MRLKALTAKAFLAWLSQGNGNDHVGRRQSLCACPLAKFVEAIGPQRSLSSGHVVPVNYVEVGSETLMVFSDPINYTNTRAKAYELPVWARDFVAMIDDNPTINASVSRGECIHALLYTSGD